MEPYSTENDGWPTCLLKECYSAIENWAQFQNWCTHGRLGLGANDDDDDDDDMKSYFS